MCCVFPVSFDILLPCVCFSVHVLFFLFAFVSVVTLVYHLNRLPTPVPCYTLVSLCLCTPFLSLCLLVVVSSCVIVKLSCMMFSSWIIHLPDWIYVSCLDYCSILSCPVYLCFCVYLIKTAYILASLRPCYTREKYQGFMSTLTHLLWRPRKVSHVRVNVSRKVCFLFP